MTLARGIQQNVLFLANPFLGMAMISARISALLLSSLLFSIIAADTSPVGEGNSALWIKALTCAGTVSLILVAIG